MHKILITFSQTFGSTATARSKVYLSFTGKEFSREEVSGGILPLDIEFSTLYPNGLLFYAQSGMEVRCFVLLYWAHPRIKYNILISLITVCQYTNSKWVAIIIIFHSSTCYCVIVIIFNLANTLHTLCTNLGIKYGTNRKLCIMLRISIGQLPLSLPGSGAHWNQSQCRRQA